LQSLLFESREKIDSSLIKGGETHLWWLSLDVDESLLSGFQSLLSEKQLKKLERLPSKKKKQRYIAGRGYLYQLLQHYLPSKASRELKFGKHGKPSLKDTSLGLSFNFTDTCGYGLFAFSIDGELGVDVENLSREGSFERVIERRFAVEEQEQLALVSTDQHVEYFLRCWTRKEAYGKAMGCGLNYTLRDHLLCIDLSQANFFTKQQTEPEKDEDQKRWCGQQFSIEHNDDKFVACLFSKGSEVKKLKAFQLTQGA
jgi:4'-phosphopantetheinyl transferase